MTLTVLTFSGLIYKLTDINSNKNLVIDSSKTSTQINLKRSSNKIKNKATSKVQEEKMENRSALQVPSLLEIEKAYQSRNTDEIKKLLAFAEKDLNKYLSKGFSMDQLEDKEKADFIKLFRMKVSLQKILIDRELEGIL